jgi:SAM-dependent methyltransferase
MIEQLKQKRFMYPHFVDGIITGQFRKLPLIEIRKMIRERYFSFVPLTELSDQENGLLENLLVKNLDETLNRENLKLLCEPVYIHEGGNPYFVNLYVKDEVPDDHGQLRLLSPKEKIDLFFNPNKWLKIRINSPCVSSCVTRYGNRNLVAGGGYFQSEDEFRNLLKRIGKESSTERLLILDIGCGMGLALQDMKDLDHNLETHGITREQEPAMFNADYFHYLTAERMPLEFRGKFHLIVSNISFRYFLFPHIALTNTVKSLANGGYAYINFSYDRIPETPESREYFLKQVPSAKSNYDAMEVLVGKVMSKVKIAQMEGKIRFTTSEHFYQYGMQGRIYIEKIND